LGLGTELGLNATWKFGLDQIRYYNIVNYCIIKCMFYWSRISCVCSVYYQPNPSRRGGPCHGPQMDAFSDLWAIPSTEPGPQPLLVTYNLSSLALTPGEPTPYVCMYVSMVCGMYVGMCWVRGESTQVHR